MNVGDRVVTPLGTGFAICVHPFGPMDVFSIDVELDGHEHEEPAFFYSTEIRTIS